MEKDVSLQGESKNVEYKERVPEDSQKYMKSVVAFANGDGGRIVFGVEDGTMRIVGIPQADLFQIMDTITNAVTDSCEPMIIPDLFVQEIEGKSLIIWVCQEFCVIFFRNLCRIFPSGDQAVHQ